MRIAQLSPWLVLAAVGVPVIAVFVAMGYVLIGIPAVILAVALGGGALASFLHDD